MKRRDFLTKSAQLAALPLVAAVGAVAWRPNAEVTRLTVGPALKYLPLSATSDAYRDWQGLYLNPDTGDDSNSGLSPADAKKTFENAYDLLQPGDSILLIGGP